MRAFLSCWGEVGGGEGGEGHYKLPRVHFSVDLIPEFCHGNYPVLVKDLINPCLNMLLIHEFLLDFQCKEIK